MSPIITSNHQKSLVDFLSRWGINVHILTKMQAKITHFADRFSTLPLPFPLSSNPPFPFPQSQLHWKEKQWAPMPLSRRGCDTWTFVKKTFHGALMKKKGRDREHISINFLFQVDGILSYVLLLSLLCYLPPKAVLCGSPMWWSFLWTLCHLEIRQFPISDTIFKSGPMNGDKQRWFYWYFQDKLKKDNTAQENFIKLPKEIFCLFLS